MVPLHIGEGPTRLKTDEFGPRVTVSKAAVVAADGGQVLVPTQR